MIWKRYARIGAERVHCSAIQPVGGRPPGYAAAYPWTRYLTLFVDSVPPQVGGLSQRLRENTRQGPGSLKGRGAWFPEQLPDSPPGNLNAVLCILAMGHSAQHLACPGLGGPGTVNTHHRGAGETRPCAHSLYRTRNYPDFISRSAFLGPFGWFAGELCDELLRQLTSSWWRCGALPLGPGAYVVSLSEIRAFLEPHLS